MKLSDEKDIKFVSSELSNIMLLIGEIAERLPTSKQDLPLSSLSMVIHKVKGLSPNLVKQLERLIGLQDEKVWFFMCRNTNHDISLTRKRYNSKLKNGFLTTVGQTLEKSLSFPQQTKY
jgi:hypothetical protein